MSYLRPAPGESELPALEAIRTAFGFVPNYFRAQVMRPDLIDAQVQLIDAIQVKDGALTRQEKEYVFLVCSAANLSTYCVTAHCEIVRLLGIHGPEPEQVALDHTTTNLPVPLKALLTFARKLTTEPTTIGARDVEALRTYGYTDEQILEAVLVVGLAKLANFVAFGLGTVPDFDPRFRLGEEAARPAAPAVGAS